MNKTFFNRMTSSKEFEIWLKQKDQRLHHVSNRLTEALTHGYSIETINSLYSWLIASFSNLESAHDEESIYLLDCCSTYIGECFIYLYGGYWHLQSNKKDHAFGYPGIIDYRSSGNNKIPKHPHIWVTTSIHRRSNIIYDSFMKYDLLVAGDTSLVDKKRNHETKIPKATVTRVVMKLDFYKRVVLIPSSAKVSFETIITKIRSKFARIDDVRVSQPQSNEIRIQASAWYLNVNWEDGPHVLAESQEIAGIFGNDDNREVIQSSNLRITTAARPDPNMDYFNYYVYVLEILEAIPNVYQFDAEQGKLWITEDSQSSNQDN